MTYVSIAGKQYPATITGRLNDKDWGGRASKAIKLEMSYAEAIELWTEGAAWSILTEERVMRPKVDEEGNEIFDENGELIMVETEELEEFDNSDYSVSGDIIDHRDGYVTVKMGKKTELELATEYVETLSILLGEEA